MSDLFKSLLKEADNKYASVVEDGVVAGDVNSYVDTGSLSFNALLSGSIYNGIPGNNVSALAGEPATGKTFIAINVVKKFLEDNPKGFVFYFESESAISKRMIEERGVDTSRIVIAPVTTVQEFRTQILRILDKYLETPKKDRLPMFFVLDSLGNLSTEKEMTDIKDGKDTRDMTRSQLIKAAFRVITLKLGIANSVLLVTNHVYEQVGAYIPTKKMNGGSGLEYAASTIIFLTKKKDKDKDTNEVTGAIISATVKKGRLTVENKKVDFLLNYQTGLDKYYGLLPLAEKFGIFKKLSTKYELPDGTTAFEKHIVRNPEKYFTEDVLEAIDAGCALEFMYGGAPIPDDEEYDINEPLMQNHLHHVELAADKLKETIEDDTRN